MKNSLKIILAIALFFCLAFTSTSIERKKQIHVVIDAGHGGKDYGAVSDTFTEKDIVNTIGTKIKEANSNKDVIIHFTRPADEFVTLEERVNIINNIKPDLVLSLHVNASLSKKFSGMEIFINKSADSKTTFIANTLYSKLEASQFDVKVKEAGFYILKNSEYPVMTLEMGYITTTDDKQLLTTDAGQEKIAKAVIEFIQELK